MSVKKTNNDLVSYDLKYSVDLVIHLAKFYLNVRDSLNRPEEYQKYKCDQKSKTFLISLKTQESYTQVHQQTHDPWVNPYAMNKYSLERIAPANSINMRFTTVYNPNARESMLIPRILRNDVPYINTNHSRDFIHVDDLVR